MTEKELISKLQSLKQIKPRENWVIFTKSHILSNEYANQPTIKANYAGVFNSIFKAAFSRNFAYSAAVFLFITTVGIFVIMKGAMPNNSNVNVGQVSTASLVAIQGNVEEFKVKSKTLSDLASYNSSDVSLAIKEVEEVAKEITSAIQKDPQLAKVVALEVNNNKTYLEITGDSDLKETSDILYKIIVEQMIKDMESVTLTESHQESLDIVKDLYSKSQYTNALESILLLNSAVSESN